MLLCGRKVMLVRQAVEFRVTLRTVAVSFVSSVFVFALIYAVFVRFNVSSSALCSAVTASDLSTKGMDWLTDYSPPCWLNHTPAGHPLVC